MGPYGSVGAHIKTGESSMAEDHFKTPPDPKKGHPWIYWLWAKGMEAMVTKLSHTHRWAPWSTKEKRWHIYTKENRSNIEPVFLLIQARSPYLTPGRGGGGWQVGKWKSTVLDPGGVSSKWYWYSATYPQARDFQKYGSHFSGGKRRLRQRTHKSRASKNMGALFCETKKACSNIPTS